MGGSDVQYNYPDQPSYGEGMADALKAQVELLTGQGEFAGIAPEGLKGLLPLEEDIRRETAQTDTDILRQTLLGTTSGGGEQEVTYDDEGRIIRGYKEAPKYEVRQRIFQQELDIETGRPIGEGFKEVPSSDRMSVTRVGSYEIGGSTFPVDGYYRFELVDPEG